MAADFENIASSVKRWAVEHSLELASEKTEVVRFERIPLEIVVEAVAWEIEGAFETAVHREQLDYFHELEEADKRIEVVICTFAFDWARGMEYWDRFAGTDKVHREHMLT